MADIKQYVNLDPDKPDHLGGLDKARAGRKVSFEATITPKAEGVAVVFQITFGQKNLVDANRVIKRAATTDKDGKAKLEYELSKDGGDEFGVKAFVKESDPAVLDDKYIVWRRFYCQVARLGPVAKGAGRGGGEIPAVADLDITPIKTEYEAREHNIEIVVDGGVKQIARAANIIETGSEPYKKCAKDGYIAAREPVTCRIVHVHAIEKPKTMSVTVEDLERDATHTARVAQRLWKDESMPKDQDWLISAEWKYSEDEDDTFSPLPAGTVTRKQNFAMRIDLGAAGIDEREDDPDATVDVKITYRCVGGANTGWAHYNAIWLSETSNGVARSAADKVATLAHEVGHFLGMVPATQASTYYTGHGHTGGHCSTGLSDEDKGLDDDDGGASKSYNGLIGTCIMFGQFNDKRKTSYCADCDPSVRKSKVTRNAMPSSW